MRAEIISLILILTIDNSFERAIKGNAEPVNIALIEITKICEKSKH